MTSGSHIRSYRGTTPAAALGAYADDAQRAGLEGWFPTGQAWADNATEHVLIVTYARRPTSADAAARNGGSHAAGVTGG